jgi:Uma2 family endonuclease
MSGTSDRPMTQQGPVWEVAELFPDQGEWTEAHYLALNTNRMVEFSNGFVEFLPMPTLSQQLILLFLYDAMKAHVSASRLGIVLVAPFRVKLWESKYREPDLLFLKEGNRARLGEQFCEGADLVMEVVSDDESRRDVEIKRAEYARAGIPEYWIVDPQAERITVLFLDGEIYTAHGEFGRGTTATSRLLPGFSLEADPVFSLKK